MKLNAHESEHVLDFSNYVLYPETKVPLAFSFVNRIFLLLTAEVIYNFITLAGTDYLQYGSVSQNGCRFHG
jgi:hypothetical protein